MASLITYDSVLNLQTELMCQWNMCGCNPAGCVPSVCLVWEEKAVQDLRGLS